jgi:hypothetical protein
MCSPGSKRRPIPLPRILTWMMVPTFKKEQRSSKNDTVNIFLERYRIQSNGRKYDRGTQSSCPGTELPHNKRNPNFLHQHTLAQMWQHKRPSPCRVKCHANPKNGTMARHHVQRVYTRGTCVFLNRNVKRHETKIQLCQHSKEACLSMSPTTSLHNNRQTHNFCIMTPAHLLKQEQLANTANNNNKGCRLDITKSSASHTYTKYTHLSQVCGG